MADSSINITAGSGTAVDTRTETGGQHRQVIVLGDPSATDAVAEVRATDPDSNSEGVVVRDVHSSAIVAKLNSGVAVSGTLTGITNTIAVYFDRGDPGVKVSNPTNATLGVNIGTIAGTTAVHITGTSGTLGVNIGTIAGTTAVFIQGTGGTLGVNIGTIAGTTAVYLHSTGGTLVTKIDPGNTVFVNAAHTAGIFTVSGSTSGGTTSGVTLVAPSAAYNFKVFAYSIQTTGILSNSITLTNGAESATEFWRPLVTAAATASSPVGANLAVQPPGFLFATGTSTTLAIKQATAALIHYSVSYIKESA